MKRKGIIKFPKDKKPSVPEDLDVATIDQMNSQADSLLAKKRRDKNQLYVNLLKKRALDLSALQEDLDGKLKQFFNGRFLKVTAKFWNGQSSGGRSWPNQSGKVMVIEDSYYYGGKIYFLVNVRGQNCAINYDDAMVSLIERNVHG